MPNYQPAAFSFSQWNSGNVSRECSSGGAQNAFKPLVMFALTSENTFHLYSHCTDMRKSFDALSGLVRNNLGYNPINGEVFIFINKSRDKIKLLHWQGSGYILYYKRLEKGTFELPRYDASVGSISLSYAQMVMIMDGLSIRNLQKRIRYTALEAPVNQV